MSESAVGTEAEQLARLDHLAEKHGLTMVDCPKCAGAGCPACDNFGVFLSQPALTCDDPNCEATRVMRSRMA